MKNKKNIIALSIGVITLIIAVLGATYAYFIAQGNGSGKTDINVGTSTTDNLSFSFGDLININANETNFAEGLGNISDSTTGTAILKANNATNSASAKYNIYLIIESNDFVYTTEEGTPEILLNVTDPNGNTGKTLTGKLYLTQEQMSSYELTEINNIEATTTYNSIDATLDITNGSGEVSKYYYGIEKATNTRSATAVEYQESDSASYKFTNLEPNTEYTVYSYVEDENKIKSNVYETKIKTDEYTNAVINNVSHSVTLNSITLTVNASNGSNEIVKYMYSKDNGSTWEESTSNTYTFNNLNDTTEYKIKVKVVDSEGYESTEYYEAITTEVYILPVVSSVNASTTWNSITLTPSGTNGTNTISKYVYSINNGAYQDSNVFNNLTDNTKYTIKVKAIDSANRESNEYTMEVTTDAYKLPTINNVTLSSTANSITINVDATSGDGNIVSYHYSKDDGSNYTQSSNNSYTFSGLTSNTTFYIKVYVTDNNGRVSTVTSKSIATTEPINLANHIKSLYTSDGANGIYLHDGSGIYGSQEAGDGSYRFAGANPNNYVCFGSDASTCPADNLYRIIGVFGNQVKLIKNTSIGNYYWSGSSSNTSNTWRSSTLNTGTLNGTYLNGLGSKWSNLISTHAWKVEGITTSQRSTPPKSVYNYEVGSSSSSTTYNAKIGLMYISDFGYAASPNYWTTELYNYEPSKSSNWMAGLTEWTISRTSDDSLSAFYVYSAGNVASGGVFSGYGVRPSFYLESTVGFSSGSGTQTDPYRVSL